ncbi:MAG: hypothetical protein GY943_29485, partial [Chloroflexi bacterium]|nr:hypothetical protein [Chloroflexota bacterium]
ATRRHVVILPILSIIAAFTVMRVETAVGYTGFTPQTMKDIVRWTQPQESEPYTLVTMSNEFHIYPFIGLLTGDFIHHWYSPNQTTQFDQVVENTKGQLLTFVADRVHVDPTYSGKDLEWWLNNQFYRFDSTWIDDYELVKYAIVSTDSWVDSTLYIKTAFLNVETMSLNKTTFSPHDALAMQLRVCKTDDFPEAHALFVHLVSDTQVIEGLDGPIHYGGINMHDLNTGDCVTEKRGIYIPRETQAGSYQLIFGVVASDGRITMTNDAGEQIPYSTLTTIQIQSAD